MVDLDSALREQLLEVPVCQPEAQIPPDRQQDHIRREPVARQSRSSDFDLVAVATGSHVDSLTPPSPTSQRNRAPAGRRGANGADRTSNFQGRPCLTEILG